MATGVNLHDACRVGVIVSQHFNPKTNLQIHGRLNRLGQKHSVIWHCLKVKDSFHDHQDWFMLTKWARQLSAESNVKSWLSGAPREMVLFEIMKTYANLIDPKGLMANMKGIDFKVETAHLIQTALPGSLPEKKKAQLSAIARDEETAMIEYESESEKNTGPEADQDISMEKLRDMSDQLGYQTLATVSIARRSQELRQPSKALEFHLLGPKIWLQKLSGSQPGSI
ncbi:hypothetical protein J3E68DRAFT_448616 [Trichoderma sp. SZMC 28012]